VLAPGAKDQLQSDILWKAVCNKESNFKERLLQLQPKEDEATKLPALQALSRSRSEGAQTWRARAVQSDACTQTTVYAEKVMRIPEVRVLNGRRWPKLLQTQLRQSASEPALPDVPGRSSGRSREVMVKLPGIQSHAQLFSPSTGLRSIYMLVPSDTTFAGVLF
ncbi:unnamed protein product, partial [Polarella glacialis]